MESRSHILERLPVTGPFLWALVGGVPWLRFLSAFCQPPLLTLHWSLSAWEGCSLGPSFSQGWSPENWYQLIFVISKLACDRHSVTTGTDCISPNTDTSQHPLPLFLCCWGGDLNLYLHPSAVWAFWESLV